MNFSTPEPQSIHMISEKLVLQFDRLKEKFASIQHYQRLVSKNTDDILKQLFDELAGSEELSGELKELFSSSLSNFFYPNPQTGDQQLYSHKKTSIQETIDLTYLYKNRQYQWLLSEAFEAFEQFVKAVYVICGVEDADFWHSEHMRKNFPENPTHEDFAEAAKFLTVTKILNRVRVKVPSISQYETGHLVLGHLKFYLTLIEKIRHISVHANGVTSDKEKVVIDILRGCNALDGSEAEAIARASIENYFGTGDYENHILLLEQKVNIHPVISSHINRQEYLANKMLSYSHLLVFEVASFFDRKLTDQN